MSFIGYLDKMRLGGGNKQRDTNPPRRRGIQPNSGARPSSSSAAIINSAPSSMIALVESDSGNEPTDEDEDYNDPEQVNEEEPVDNDDSGSNPENPYEFAPSDPLNEEKLMAEEHWSRGQLDLWHKIKGRGSYPIFPPNWMLDFSNLPDELFVDPSLDPIIGAMNKKLEVRAMLAFDNLMQLGGRVRDKMESGQNVEKWLGKELEKYVAWAMKDGDIPSTYTGVFAVAASPQFEVCERRMFKRMAELSERHRTALETSRQFYASRRNSLLSSHASNSSTKNLRLLPSPLPPDSEPPAANLYGFAIVESRVALVALNTAKIEAPMRTLLVVNYSDPGMDVWNAIAIALMVCQARDEQMARVEWARKIAAETGFEGWGGFEEEDL